MSGPLPPAGVGVIARALLTYGRKPQPLSQTFRAVYACPWQEPKRVDDYKKFIGFPCESSVPLSYWYLLAQRAQLALMMDPRFSYPVPGIVHVSNAMHQFETVDVSKPLDIEVSATQDAPDASGSLYVVFEVFVRQGGLTKVRCKSRYLGRRATRGAAHTEVVSRNNTDFQQIADWVLEPNVGRLYAKISGDYNPIHLWPWSAKVLGFGKPIAHGMFLVSKTQATLEQSMGARLTQLTAIFMKPAPLPGSVRLECTSNAYRLMSGAVMCAKGTYSAQAN